MKRHVLAPMHHTEGLRCQLGRQDFRMRRSGLSELWSEPANCRDKKLVRRNDKTVKTQLGRGVIYIS